MIEADVNIFRELHAQGLIVEGIEGDASVPRGTRRVYEIEEFQVEDEWGVDVTDDLIPAERRKCEEGLIDAYLGR